MTAPARLDLHVHTTASDGAWSPADVVRGAAAGGLDIMAVTDHDTAAAFHEAHAAGRAAGVQVVPALEVSSGHGRRDVHVLGYFVDPSAPPLVAHAERATTHRERRMHEMIGRLRGAGVGISYEQVTEAAGPDRVALGRPHLARALVAAGHASSVDDAFARLIGDDAPAFVPAYVVDPPGAVDLVVAAGGVPVWAHPPADLLPVLLPSLIESGLRGLEVYRPRARRADVTRLEALCRARGLLASGGSDWHTPDGGTALGDFAVTSAQVAGLLEAGGL